ncbi:MAG: divalent-cation tolerance protein CutA [Pseudomonadota bacterium]|uniref:Periplasmic divalent cation tolerance protein CutA n=1 Tax=hydrothermal vent metagenome TaxID=652676 RepID=A0A160TI61_9ZZZZ
MSRIRLVRTTFGNADEAARIARAMIEDRLAACASLSAVHSIYRWQGKVEADDETAVLFKTTPDRAAALSAAIDAQHSYDQPVIEAWEADVDPAVADWVYAETAKVS